MHSISYVKVNNEVEKGFINDRLVQVLFFIFSKFSTSHTNLKLKINFVSSLLL